MKYTSHPLNQLPHIYQPIVYGWKRNGKFLYIGKSTRGVERILTHSVIVHRNIKSTDLITIWLTSIEEMDSLEKHLINKYQPTFNVTRTHKRRLQPKFDLNGTRICYYCLNQLSLEDRPNKIFCDNKCRNNYWNHKYNEGIEENEAQKTIRFIKDVLKDYED